MKKHYDEWSNPIPSLQNLKKQSLFQWLLKNNLLSIRVEVYEKGVEPQETIKDDVFMSIDDAIEFIKPSNKDYDVYVFVDGCEDGCLNVFDVDIDLT